MDARQAAQKAKEYIAEVFADEAIKDIGLEEVVFDELSNTWQITIGFVRSWNQPKTTFTEELLGTQTRNRSYKVIHIDDESGLATALTDRVLPALK